MHKKIIHTTYHTGKHYTLHPPPGAVEQEVFTLPLANTENIFSVLVEWQYGHSGALVSPIFLSSLNVVLQILHLNSYTGIIKNLIY